MKGFATLGAAVALALVAGYSPAQISEVGLSFDGITGYVHCGSATELNFGGTAPFTIEAWVRTGPFLGTAGPHRMIVSKYNGGVGAAWWFGVRNNDTLGFSREITPHTMTGVTGVPVGNWNHVAATYDGTTMRTYVNGVLDVSDARGSSATSPQPVLIGARLVSSSPSDYFHGVMDELRIWDVAKSGPDLIASMNAPLTGSEADLVGYWNMNELQNLGVGGDGLSDDLEDLSSNANHGDLNATGVQLVTSDVSVSITASEDTIEVGEQVVYTVTVLNTGPMLAASTEITVTFPANMTFESTTLAGGTYVLTGTGIEVDPQDLLDQQSAVFDVVMTGATEGADKLTVTAEQAAADMVQADNTAEEETTVVPPASEVGEWLILD